MKSSVLLLTGLGMSVLLAGCGAARVSPQAVSVHHHVPKRSARKTAASHLKASAGLAADEVTWYRLPLRQRMGYPARVAAMTAQNHRVLLKVVSYIDPANPQVRATRWVAWQAGSLAVGTLLSENSRPASSSASAYQLLPAAQEGGPARLMDGPAPALTAWPKAVATYTSLANPAGNQFQMDNEVIGQAGPWIYVALKGPKAPAVSLAGEIWGYRYWNRLVALNVKTGQYRLLALPRSYSETLDYPLWENPPSFAASAHHIYVGVGEWVGVFPENPLSIERTVRHGAPTAALDQARVDAAQRLVNTESWQSVDADAAFWNCYVMKDTSVNACPGGTGYPASLALSQQPTFFNHGDVGFALAWALNLPMDASQASARRAAVTRFDAALSGSLFMNWIAINSAAGIRREFPGGPPKPLPGYYRKDRLYWAQSPGGGK